MQLSTFTLLAIAGAASAQMFIHPSVDSTKCLSGNQIPGIVTIEPCANDMSQIWTIQGNTLTIFGTTCLDNTDGITTNGNKVQAFQCFSGNTNQEWTVSGLSNAATIALAGTTKCLDNTGGSDNDGNPVQIWDCTGGRNQKWSFTSSTAPPAGNTISPGKSSDLCLLAVSDNDNAPVTVGVCDGNNGESWRVVNGNLQVFENKCLDVPNGDTTNGVKLQIFTCFSGNTNQLFTVTGDNRIAWTNKGECLDLTDGNTTPGTQVQMFKCTDNNSNQVWNFS